MFKVEGMFDFVLAMEPDEVERILNAVGQSTVETSPNASLYNRPKQSIRDQVSVSSKAKT